MTRPVGAHISLDILRNNLHIVQKKASDSKVWAVVKANAYGHRLAQVWSAFSAADGYAMLNIEEAILLRENGWQGPLLLLEGFFTADELVLLDKYRLTTSVHSDWQIDALAVARLDAPLNVYLKMNSGMNRLGFAPERVHHAWHRLRRLSNVGDITLMAHFASADRPDGIHQAFQCIEQTAQGLDCPRSLANSAATLWHPQTHFDWVRSGIILYGVSPSGRWQDIASTGLRPAMTLHSEIIGIQHLKAGDRVGYGGRYAAVREQRIGIVACGYGDGYPRGAPDGTPVLVDGIRTGTVGMISMDMMAVDLTPCPQAEIGTPVVLWGGNLHVDDVAAAAGTIGYELVCALAPRVPVIVV